MHPRARRAVSFGLSVAVHALLLLQVYGMSVMQPGLSEPPPLPVRILDEPPPPPQAAPKPPPPQVAAKPAEPVPPPEAAKPVEEPPPEPPPQPERKIPLPEQQIVSPPDAGKNEAPPDTRLLSDRDNRVEQQMVKKGNPAPGEESPGEKAAKADKPAQPPKRDKPAEQRRGPPPKREPPQQVAKLPGLDRLLPDALRMAEESYASAAPPGEQMAKADLPRRLQPRGSEGIMMPMAGPIGTLDFLPDVSEGDITLLNTKAEVFAPFVRRVAVRVFQNFVISLKRDLANSNIPTTEMVEAEAVMDAHGEMIGFNVHQRSARISLATDRRLQQACHDGFFDRNPPPGARAKDGKIHFVFTTAVQHSPGPRGGAYWITMAAGLQ